MFWFSCLFSAPPPSSIPTCPLVLLSHQTAAPTRQQFGLFRCVGVAIVGVDIALSTSHPPRNSRVRRVDPAARNHKSFVLLDMLIWPCSCLSYDPPACHPPPLLHCCSFFPFISFCPFFHFSSSFSFDPTLNPLVSRYLNAFPLNTSSPPPDGTLAKTGLSTVPQRNRTRRGQFQASTVVI